MSVRTQVETDLALSRGVDLAWLTIVAPDVMRQWLQDHASAVDTLTRRILTRR